MKALFAAFCISLLYSSCLLRACQAENPTEVEIEFEYDSPLYPTVYRVIQGGLNGIQGVFHDPEIKLLNKDDYFTVVLDTRSPRFVKKRGWYEIPAIFCFGDKITRCLGRAMNKSTSYRQPYLVKPTNVETPVPFMVPFKNIINVNLSNHQSVPGFGIVHPDFSSRNFSLNGATYDTTTGVIVSFTVEHSTKVGKLANVKFSRKRHLLPPQPLIECYFVEWAPDGCMPGLNTLMKAWDMKYLKIQNPRWLKVQKFPANRDEEYVQNLYIFEHGSKSYVVPKEVFIDSVVVGTVPFSYVYESVKEQVKSTLHSYGIGYEEKTTGVFQGSARYNSYSNLYSARSYSAAMSGMDYKLFRVRFRTSFNFRNPNNWEWNFRREFQAMMSKRDKELAMDFFNEYGTHYIREAEMGGRKQSLLTVNYCALTKDKTHEAKFKAELMIPYKGQKHTITASGFYQNNMSESSRKMIIAGPFTTCRGGNSLNLKVCLNDTLWHPTVLLRPYPVTMVVEPFYDLPTNDADSKWLQEKYKEYLKSDLNEVQLNKELDVKAECDVASKGAYTDRFMVFLCPMSLVALRIIV